MNERSELLQGNTAPETEVPAKLDVVDPETSVRPSLVMVSGIGRDVQARQLFHIYDGTPNGDSWEDMQAWISRPIPPPYVSELDWP